MVATFGEKEYSPIEMLVCIGARLVKDSTTAFIGTGIPLLVASLAQKMHAPNLVPVFEFGGIGAPLDSLPLSVAGWYTFHRAVAASGICAVMETATRGLIEYGFLGGAQIDPYGNLNSTVIGDYAAPRVRLPGSGGANDLGSLCWRTIIFMRHDRRRFVEKVDFITTPGYLTGPGAREQAGLCPDTGPYRVVTNLAVLGFDDGTKRMKLLATNPDVSVEQVIENTSFDLIIPNGVSQNAPPSAQELRILREEVDKDRMYI